MGHHHHDHHHCRARHGNNRRFGWGIALNLIFVAVELYYGFAANSLALVADAWHNFSDVFSLALAWFALYLAQRKPTRQYTYGYKRASILASLANAVLLLVAVAWIVFEAVQRLQQPADIATNEMMIVAGIGIVINGTTAMLFARDHKHDINIRGAYLHMLADAAVSLGVVIAALLIGFTGWLWLDPAISLVVAVVIVIGTWDLLKESLNMAMDAIPRRINSQDVENYLRNLPDIESVHDLHIWALSSSEVALTAHLVSAKPDYTLPKTISADLKEKFGIGHTTIQMEAVNDCVGCN